MPSRPLRVAVVNDYALVVAGVAGLLRPFDDRVAVIEVNSQEPVVSVVDVVLFDTFGLRPGEEMDPDALLARGAGSPAVVVFGWNTDPALVQAALAAGARGYVSKGVDADVLVRAIERVAAGEQVTPDLAAPTRVVPDGESSGLWPGSEQGLTVREAEVLALLCRGLTNQEIAERAFIGLNTVKTHLRVLFQKIGVDSRTRAVLWGVDHGFRPGEHRSTREPRP